MSFTCYVHHVCHVLFSNQHGIMLFLCFSNKLLKCSNLVDISNHNPLNIPPFPDFYWLSSTSLSLLSESFNCKALLFVVSMFCFYQPFGIFISLITSVLISVPFLYCCWIWWFEGENHEHSVSSLCRLKYQSDSISGEEKRVCND